MKEQYYTVAVRLILLGIIVMGYVTASVLAQNGSDPTTGRIIYIDPARPPGKLKVKQKKGEKPADATVGMPVRRGYLLTLDSTAKAAVLCADNKRYDLLHGPQGCPCTTAKQGVFYEGSTILPPRGSNKNNTGFPLILSPRKMFLLTTRPTIRWSPVTGHTPGVPVTYRVSLYTDAAKPKLVWSREISSQTKMDYPGDEKELVRGETYNVVIEAGETSSKQEGANDLGFTVITEDQVKSIAGSEAGIRQLELPEGEMQLLIVNLYAAQGLSSEAIEKLTLLAKTLKEPAVLRMLGDLYAASGLYPEAVREYESALALPQIKSDIEGQALTLAALGRSYVALGDDTQANSRFARAVEAFGKLGDVVTAKQLRDGQQE